MSWWDLARRGLGLTPDADERAATNTIDALVRGDAREEHSEEGLDPSMAFALRLGRGLLQSGVAASRVEEALDRIGNALGLDVDVFSTPTALIITLAHRSSGDARTRVVRVQPGTTDLAKMSALHELVGRVERRELAPGDAALRIEAILARPARMGPATTALGYALVTAASAILLGGSGLDVTVAAALAVGIGVLEAVFAKAPTVMRLVPGIAATMVALLASVMPGQGIPVRPSVLLFAALVVVLPGLTVTTAMIELASAHLVSGTVRMFGGLVTFLQLGFGIALGQRLSEFFARGPRPPRPEPLPDAVALLAPLLAALGFIALLRVRPRDGIIVLVASALALVGSRLGARALGPELGAFLAATIVAMSAHSLARWRDRPISLMLVPGMLSLVPGSIGFLSINSILDDDVVSALRTGFRMSLVAMSLAAGVLVATAAVPPRKAF